LIAGAESDSGEGTFKARAGALTLLYLASPMKRDVLLSFLAEAATGAEVVERIETPDPDDPALLEEIVSDPYLVEAADPDREPGAPIDWETALRASPAGRELNFVGDVLEDWLDSCPSGALSLGPDAAPALAALLNGWSSTIVHTLAAQPLTISEVTEAIGTLSYEFVEELVDDLERAGLIHVVEEEPEERFAVTDWLRAAIAPLAAAARVEKRHPPGDTAPIAALDVEAAFLLTLPLLELPAELSGACSLAVDLDEGVVGSPTGVTAEVADGRVVTCAVGIDADTDAWASASAAGWLDTVIDGDASLVRSGSDQRLSDALLYGLHQALFPK
jgi:DNA-binding HxlR family transcriptional regulator